MSLPGAGAGSEAAGVGASEGVAGPAGVPVELERQGEKELQRGRLYPVRGNVDVEAALQGLRQLVLQVGHLGRAAVQLSLEKALFLVFRTSC